MAALVLVLGFTAGAQQPATAPSHPPATHAGHAGHPAAPKARPISEDELRLRLQGKTVCLLGGYFGSELRFDEFGHFAGSSPQVSYTLSMVEIDKVTMSRHRVQFEGIRYGLHFLGTSPTEDLLTASDRVRITPRKKVLRITIDRAKVVKPHKKPKSSKDQPDAPAAQSAATPDTGEGSVSSQAAANQRLEEALQRVFSAGLDEHLVASLPDYWRLYFQAAANKANFKPSDPSVLHQNAVDRKARLITTFEPPSNDFAQQAGVAGVAQYHVVVGPDGKPAEIAVGRPIGLGLDENAVASIRKAQFQPAMKDGKTVPVLLDLLVQFRIYSNRTGLPAADQASGATLAEPEAAPLPGPCSANQPPAKEP
jgi:outer membrane biosynthesis protein TonB